MSRARQPARRFVWILALVLSLGLSIGCKQKPPLSSFEKLQADAFQKNPDGLQVELRTPNGKTTYHLYENIPIDLVFSSTKPVTYSIERVEGMNAAGITDRLYVAPEEAAFENRVLPSGIICCGSDRPYLWPDPTLLHRDLTDFIRFEKPGKYQVFYSTRRIFRGKTNRNSTNQYHEPSEITAASNLLTLTILPDDPDWDAKRLADVLQRMNDPRVRGEHARAVAKINPGSLQAVALAYANDLPQTELNQAQVALAALDTEEAIRARVALIPAFARHAYGDLGPLISTTQAALMVEMMEERARQRNFGISYNFTRCWEIVLVKRDRPEIFRPRLDDAMREQRPLDFGKYIVDAETKVLDQLKTVAGQKAGPARVMTQQTIDDISRDIGWRKSAEKTAPSAGR